MNRIYKTLWSASTQSWQAVPENARTAGKKSTSSAAGVVASVALGFALSGAARAQSPPAINQLPTGGSVVRGTATFSQTATAQAAAMTVNQSSQRAVINWNTFNLGSAASVNFVQPNAQAVTLNRVNDSNPSQIFGRITANGQVFLTNANGVYFSPTSSVDVGAFTATTHSISDDNFMSGKYVFERNGSTGKVTNEGHINAALGGYVALLAPEVQNAGVVVAKAGTVAMAAGEMITLTVDNNGSLAGIATTPSTIATLVENKHAVLAPDGQIILSAVALDKLQAGVIKNSGSLEANSISHKGGKIYLEGDDINLSSTSKIEAKGATGGGTVLIGGDWQGSGTLRQATQVTMEAGATIDASATNQGDGGKVVLWSDVHNANSMTRANGNIKAEAGPNGGDGGKVETSGQNLNVDGIQVSTQSAQGKAGEWLLDPYNITIGSSASGTTFTDTNPGDDSYTAAATSSITAAVINTALANGNVTISTGAVGSAGTDAGNITLSSNLSWATANTLTLSAAGGVTGSGAIAMTRVGGGGKVVFNQAGTSVYTGLISGTGSVTKSGIGTLTLGNASADSTYTGGTSVGLGTLKSARNTGAFGDSTGTVTVSSGASLDLNGYNLWYPITLNGTGDNGTGALKNSGQTNNYVEVRGTFTLGSDSSIVSGSGTNGIRLYGTLTGNNHALTLGGDAINAVYVGGINLGTGNLTKTGAGSWYLMHSNTLGNAYVNQGILVVNTDGALGDTSGTTTVASGATLDFSGVPNTILSEPLILSGSGANASTGALQLDVYSTLNYTGSITLNGPTLIRTEPLSTITVQSITKNGFDLVKTGTGTLNLPAGVTAATNYEYIGAACASTCASTYGTTPTVSYAVYDSSGVATTDAGITGTAVYTGAPTSTSGVGSYSIAYSSGLSSTAKVLFAYPTPLAWTVNKAHLTVTASNASRAYGAANPALSATVTGYVNGENATSAGLTGSATATTTANTTTAAGSATITAGAGTLSAANYDFVTANGTLTINKANLTVVTADKTYDGLTTVTAAQMTAIEGVNGETFTATAGTANISGKDTGITRSLTNLSGLTLSSTNGGVASNYNLSTGLPPLSFSNRVDIWQANLSKLTASKVYDGLSTVTAAQMTAIEGVNGETFIATGGTATLSGKNVAGSKSITALNLTGLSSTNGGLEANYLWTAASLPTAGSNNAATITAKPLTVTAPTVSKAYDGSTSATGSATVGALATNDVVNVAATLAFTDKNVGAANKTVHASGLTIKDASNANMTGNYVITYADNTASTITAKALTITAPVVSKEYDGTTSATGTATVGTLASGDVVNSSALLAFTDKNVGAANKTVHASGLTIKDASNANTTGNYVITYADNTASTITAKALTVTAPVVSKEYDGTTSATGTATVGALASGDVVNSSALLAFTDKNVGAANRTVHASGLTIKDASNANTTGNYVITYADNTASTITAKALTVTAPAVTKEYDGTTSATGTATVGTLAGGDVVNTSALLAFTDKNVGAANKTVHASGVTLKDASNADMTGNYAITYADNTASTITAKALTVSGTTVANKTYDGTTTATLSNGTLVGVVAADASNVTLTQLGDFADKNVGTAKTVTAADTLGGTAAGNYTLTQPTGLSANITAKALTVSGTTVANKTYDGTTTATLSNGTLVGVVGSENVTLTQAGTFVSANAGTGVSVTASDTLGGTGAGNYTLTQPTGLTANIGKAALTVTAADAEKNFGSANPALSVTVSGYVPGETAATAGVTGTGLATTTATDLTTAGTVPITASVGTLAATNYAFTRFVDGTLTIRPIAVMNNAEVSTLIGAQLANLTSAQMGSFSATQLQVFSPQQLSSLSPSQLAGMTTAQVLTLSPLQIAAISPAKIGLMSAAELSAFSNEQLQALTVSQIASIAPDHFSALSPAQIMALSITQVINLTPDQLRGFTPAQVASLSAAEIAYFDARQLAAIGIFPKAEPPVVVTPLVVETPVPPAIATSNQLPLNFDAPQTAAQETAVSSGSDTDAKDTRNKFQAAIPVMTEVAGANAQVAVATAATTPIAAVQQTTASSAGASQSSSPLVMTAASSQKGVLSITILGNTEARPAMAGVAFEQDASGVSLRMTSAPPVPPVTDKLTFTDKLTTFMVSAANGDMVEFQGSLVNKRLVIVATSSAAKQVARTEMNVVLAAAITSLGSESRVMLATLDGVVLDLR